MATDITALFDRPAGEPSLLPPDAISWQVFRNPLTMFMGGVAAVLLELGEPRVRAAIWEHSRFRIDPEGRLRSTGVAAMVMVYAGRSTAFAMATRVRDIHGRISGTTPCGQSYTATDPLLLRWVHATAAHGFLIAYRAYAREMSPADRDRYFVEGRTGAALFGVTDAVSSEAAFNTFLTEICPTLTPSPAILEVIERVRTAALLPRPLRHLQHFLVRGAVDLLPHPLRKQLGITQEGGLSHGERMTLKGLALLADRVVLPTSPAARACRRLGLPSNYLLHGGWQPSI